MNKFIIILVIVFIGFLIYSFMNSKCSKENYRSFKKRQRDRRKRVSKRRRDRNRRVRNRIKSHTGKLLGGVKKMFNKTHKGISRFSKKVGKGMNKMFRKSHKGISRLFKGGKRKKRLFRKKRPPSINKLFLNLIENDPDKHLKLQKEMQQNLQNLKNYEDNLAFHLDEMESHHEIDKLEDINDEDDVFNKREINTEDDDYNLNYRHPEYRVKKVNKTHHPVGFNRRNRIITALIK